MTPSKTIGQVYVSGVATRIFAAMPTPVVQSACVPTCITSSRRDFKALPPRRVVFQDEIEMATYEVDADGVWKKCRRRSHLARMPRESRRCKFRDSLESMGAALTQAKYLEGLCGSTSPNGWPVVWSNGLCSIFYPPHDGNVCEAVVIDWGRYLNVEGTTRECGIQLCAPHWQRFFHIGDIPNPAEVKSLYDPRRPGFLLEDLVFNATDHGDPVQAESTPAPAGSIPTAPGLVDVVLVRKWLIDSGSGMDLIDERSATPFAEFIEDGEEIQLATANGVIGSRRRLEVHLEELDIDVRPVVLQNTPCVLSLGRLVVRHGYDFVWRYDSDPFLISPEGQQIDLEVRDLCPYLNIDDGDDPPPPPPRRVRRTGTAAVAAHTTEDHVLDPNAEEFHPADKEEARPTAPAIEDGGVGELAPQLDVDMRVDSTINVGDAEAPGGDIIPEECDGRRNMKLEAMSMEHIMTHTPYNVHCPSCVRAKMSRKPARRVAHDPAAMPKKFGDLVNADHIIAHSEEAMGLMGERDALVVVDRSSEYVDCFPLMTKTADDAHGALLDFFGPSRPKYMWTDSSPELIRAIKDMHVPHGKATPSRHQNNGYCERTVRKVIEGARTLLEHAGLPSCFWSFAVRFWCHAHNIKVTDGDSPWNKRHQKGNFDKKKVIPFGCVVDYLPKPEVSRAMPKFEGRACQGIFVGYYLQPGGAWKGEYLVFPMGMFQDYDYEEPRRLTELHPVRTMEAKLVGNMSFPMKAKYDLLKRTLPMTIIKPAESYSLSPRDKVSEEVGVVNTGKGVGAVEESGSDGAMEEEALDTGGAASSGGDHPPGENAQGGDAGEKKRHFRTDAIGRTYEYDEHGNRIFKNPLHGSLRPPTIPLSEWQKLSKRNKQELHDKWKETTKTMSSGDISLPATVAATAKNEDIPHMPCMPAATQHRQRDAQERPHLNACVARTVRPAEVKTNDKARASMDLEWQRLRKVPRKDGKVGVWDEDDVREWASVRRNAQIKNEKANVGLVFGIVVEKNHELPEHDPKRKYKGRAVFQGNNVWDEEGNWAVFQELGSCPATMEAARCADAYGLMPGHDVQQADAEQAYTQAEIEGTPTWVRLPRDQWPKAWENMKDPVCPLKLALYGHPDSGGHWEAHCAKYLKEVGFTEIDPWRSCFWHDVLKLYLVVYVDDFKLAGPKAAIKRGWELIRKGIKTDDPSPMGMYLGCRHDVSERILPDTGARVRCIEYNMEDFLRSCVERYKELTGVSAMRHAATPFLQEHSEPDFSDSAMPSKGTSSAEETLRNALVTTEVERGKPAMPQQLKPYAAKILMKILYAARYARLDLLRAVCSLAQFITKWDEQCDLRLYRLVCYIHSTYHIRMTGWVGDPPSKLTPHCFADADFAGCAKTSRSTSGVHLCLLGPNTVFPLAGQSKKQGCVSHSTPEAEIVAADHAMRTSGLPSVELWERLLCRKVTLEFHEDNETCIGAMRCGYSAAMRHLGRTHGVCLRWLAERFHEARYKLYYERSALQAADIYTKAFTALNEWIRACKLINHLDPKAFWDKRGGGHAADYAKTMGSEHKGGVVFDYWVSNPWYGRESLADQVTGSKLTAPMATATATNPDKTRLCGDAVGDDEVTAYISDQRNSDEASTQTSVDDWEDASIPGGDDVTVASYAARDGDMPHPAVTAKPQRRIIFVEFCTNPDSKIGKHAPPGVEVVRLTIQDDLTTPKGLAKAMDAVNTPNAIIILFGALPCIGGSQWQRLNWHRGNADTRAKILEHRRIFEILWRNFVIVAKRCLALGGGVAFEWPRNCDYWGYQRVRTFLERHKFGKVHFDGCMYGLTSSVPSKAGKLIRKPWTIATSMKELELLCRRCSHKANEHAPCAGSDTKTTEGYTDELVISIHQAVKQWCDAQGTR